MTPQALSKTRQITSAAPAGGLRGSSEIRMARSLFRGQVGTPKSGHGRTVDLSRILAETLGQLKRQRSHEALFQGWQAMPLWVFCTRAGTPMDESKVRRAMRHVL
jgi:integrase